MLQSSEVSFSQLTRLVLFVFYASLQGTLAATSCNVYKSSCGWENLATQYVFEISVCNIMITHGRLTLTILHKPQCSHAVS